MVKPQSHKSPHPILVEVFDRMDDNGDGTISKDEFKAAFTGPHRNKYEKLLGAIGLEWEAVFSRLDRDCNDQIDFEEFVAGFSTAQHQTEAQAASNTEVAVSPGSSPGSSSRSPVNSPGSSPVMRRFFGDRDELIGSDGTLGSAGRLELKRDGSYRWFRYTDQFSEYEQSETETGRFRLKVAGPAGGTLMMFAVQLTAVGHVLLDDVNDLRVEDAGMLGRKAITQGLVPVEFTDHLVVQHDGFGSLKVVSGR